MQLFISDKIKFFDDIFRKKYHFEKYVSQNKPTVFLGIYSQHDAKVVMRHNGIKIVFLNGSDTYDIDRIKILDNGLTTFVAGSSWIDEDLIKANIKHENISLFFDDIYSWKIEPLGDSLYWYGANNSKYGKKYLFDVRIAFPDLNIITNDQNDSPKSEMPEIYKKCFAGIRPVEHDGFSQTVCELGLMGRTTIWNGVSPFTTPYEGLNGLIENIKRLRVGYNYKLIRRRAELFLVENEMKWTNLVLRLCGVSELDYLNIFDESYGRCGSIFRIQRKSDIEKIGGLGYSQYQRGWFGEQMKKLNKKELLVSKSSGYISGEWKNDGNKGYDSDFKNYNTQDKRTI